MNQEWISLGNSQTLNDKDLFFIFASLVIAFQDNINLSLKILTSQIHVHQDEVQHQSAYYQL